MNAPSIALGASRPYLIPPQSILSVGPPPERHADRVVGEMMRHLAEQQKEIREALAQIIAGGYRSASPRAQKRLELRLRRAGASGTSLTAGKKGKYSLRFFDPTGWDPTRDRQILPGNPIPDKPWLACNITELINPGKEQPPQIYSVPVVFVTHHVLSRAAQRLGIRTLEELTETTGKITDQGLLFFGRELIKLDWSNLPSAGKRIEFKLNETNKATLIFKKHETRGALVATTIF
jgi:hypothetical protein